MANAKKCDVCGKYYDENEIKIKGCTVSGIILISDSAHIIHETGIDLCDNCFNLLDSWTSGQSDIIPKEEIKND